MSQGAVDDRKHIVGIESSEFVLPESFSREIARNFGPYEIIAELARGGMGRVFLARLVGEGGFERLFAIKVMHDHLTDRDEALRMLLDEANIASQIHHPNVVAITDVGIHEGRHFLVMEYVEGCSLSELLRRTDGDQSPSLLVPLLIDALRGLHSAHELNDINGVPLNLIHRDFTPPNLLVGVDGICRVIDFGIAKANNRLTQTQTAVLKGKLSYLAPEQILEDRDINRRVDIWAAGVVMWYALTGEHPFRGQSEAGTIHQILKLEPPPPSTVGARPPACFDDLCLKALEKDQSLRFETAQEMADELHRIAVRHDLLAPHSEVAAWVRGTFSEELEQRRQLIRTFQEQGRNVAWISAPVLPRLMVTPSTSIPRRLRCEVLPARGLKEVKRSGIYSHHQEASGLRNRHQDDENVPGFCNRRPETPFVTTTHPAGHRSIVNALVTKTPPSRKSGENLKAAHLVIVPEGPPLPLKPDLRRYSAESNISKEPPHRMDQPCSTSSIQGRRLSVHIVSLLGVIVAAAISFVVSFAILALFDVAVPQLHEAGETAHKPALPTEPVPLLDEGSAPAESTSQDAALDGSTVRATVDHDESSAEQEPRIPAHQGNGTASRSSRQLGQGTELNPKKRSKSRSDKGIVRNPGF